MRSLPILLALVCAPGLLAQANCSTAAGPATSLATRTPFTGNSLYGHPNFPQPPGSTYTGFSFLFDLTLTEPIDITQIDIDLYDAGGLVDLGNGMTVVSPNQVGGTAPVELYLNLTPWMGHETNPSAWILYGSGTLTVRTPHQHSPAVFATPVSLPVGTWGIAFKVDMTTTGPNPGPLHPMLDPATPQPAMFTDPAMTITNLQFQRESWTATLASPSHWQNLEFHYNRTPGFANWTSFGSGCPAAAAPVLALDQRPVVGSTVTFETSNIAAGTVLNFWLFGFSASPFGLDLTPFGMPGCNLYLQLGTTVTNVSVVQNGLASVPLPIPLNTSFAGIVLFGQAAPGTTGVNAAGFVASNAVCVAIGTL